jgi:hypothetical protein
MVKPIQLQNSDGSRMCILEPNEAESMVSRGKARKISRRVYRLMPPPPNPSKSQESPCSLTVSDVYALASGGKMNPREYERLVGWGFFPCMDGSAT